MVQTRKGNIKNKKRDNLKIIHKKSCFLCNAIRLINIYLHFKFNLNIFGTFGVVILTWKYKVYMLSQNSVLGAKNMRCSIKVEYTFLRHLFDEQTDDKAQHEHNINYIPLP